MEETRPHIRFAQCKQVAAVQRNSLAAEMGEEPEEEREHGAENEASHDGKIEGGVFAAMNEVTGKSSQAEG